MTLRTLLGPSVNSYRKVYARVLQLKSCFFQVHWNMEGLREHAFRDRNKELGPIAFDHGSILEPVQERLHQARDALLLRLDAHLQAHLAHGLRGGGADGGDKRAVEGREVAFE
jgi:hypothetical protein